MNLEERIILWLVQHEAASEERDLLNDALEELGNRREQITVEGDGDTWKAACKRVEAELEATREQLAAVEAARGIAEQQLTVICDGVNRRCGKGPNELPLVSVDGVVKERDEFRQLLRDVLRGRRRFMRDTLGEVLFESVKAAAGDVW